MILLLFHGAAQALEADGRLAEVISVQGVGEYRPEDAQVWNPARVGQGLFLGNYVRTGDLSRMAILFRDETQIRLNQNSQLQIKNVNDRAQRMPVAAPDERSWTRVRLNEGRARMRSRRVPEGLIMETPAAFAGMRGTDWEMEVDATGRSTLTVLSGKVDFYNDFGRVTVGRGEQAVAEIGKAPVKRIITNPKERVQWVTTCHVDPLRHIYLYDHRAAQLKQVLVTVQGKDAGSFAIRGKILFDLGEWQQAEGSAQAVYRTKRPEDEDHARWLDTGWDATLQAYWENPGKRFSVSLSYRRPPARGAFYNVSSRAQPPVLVGCADLRCSFSEPALALLC
jgi:hypothetical protein